MRKLSRTSAWSRWRQRFAAKLRGHDITADEYSTALADLIRDSQVRYRLVVVNSA